MIAVVWLLVNGAAVGQEQPRQTEGHPQRYQAEFQPPANSGPTKLVSGPAQVLPHGTPDHLDEKGLWGMPYEAWVAFFTFVLAIGTFILAWATFIAANAAKEATKALPILERAYLYSMIEGENIAGTIEDVKYWDANKHDAFAAPLNACPQINLSIQNFGKTPARLVHGEIFFSIQPLSDGSQDAADWPIRYNYVLGEGDKTETIVRAFHRDITVSEAQQLENGGLRLWLYGWITYLDIWGKSHQCDVGWTYNPVLKRLTPVDSRKSQNASGS